MYYVAHVRHELRVSSARVSRIPISNKQRTHRGPQFCPTSSPSKSSFHSVSSLTIDSSLTTHSSVRVASRGIFGVGLAYQRDSTFCCTSCPSPGAFRPALSVLDNVISKCFILVSQRQPVMMQALPMYRCSSTSSCWMASALLRYSSAVSYRP